ncbi:MAG: hypothetical protein ABJB85_04365 [Nitrososphaerota archaeon]
MDSLIRNAIAEKRIDFYYDGYHRIAEPHVYGTLDGKFEFLVYQTGGGSSSGGIPNWRRIKLDKISNLTITENQFAGKRPYPSGKHSSFDRRIAIVA